MNLLKWILSYGRIIWIISAIGFGFTIDFVLRFEEKFYHYGSIYKEKEAKYTDCGKYIPAFMNECKDIAHFLSKSRFLRTFTDVMGQSNLCGRYTCTDYFFGPELTFTFFGQLIKFLSIGVTIWLFVIICKYFHNVINLQKNKQQYTNYPALNYQPQLYNKNSIIYEEHPTSVPFTITASA
jgi:hypothetical protein